MARIAFLLADDYEDPEFRVPFDRLRQRGHDVVVATPDPDAPLHGKRGDEFRAGTPTRGLDHEEFDALVIPGGYSPDKLRLDEPAVSFTRAMFASGKPVAAICHAAWMLAEADVLQGLTLTSWPSLRTDLENAGATWLDEPVVEDANLITSRKPDDLDVFVDTIERQLAHHTAAAPR